MLPQQADVEGTEVEDEPTDDRPPGVRRGRTPRAPQGGTEDGADRRPVFSTKTGTHISKNNFLRQTFRPMLRRADKLAEAAGAAGHERVPLVIGIGKGNMIGVGKGNAWG